MLVLFLGDVGEHGGLEGTMEARLSGECVVIRGNCGANKGIGHYEIVQHEGRVCDGGSLMMMMRTIVRIDK